MTFIALKNKELIKLLRGDGEYMAETSQYSPSADLTDVQNSPRGEYHI